MLAAFFLFTPLAAAAPTYVEQLFEKAPTGTFNARYLAVDERNVPEGTLPLLAYKIATERHIDPELFVAVISCENDTWNPTRQSEILYSFSDPRRGIVKGNREESYGLAMIHLPDHPDISKEEATNPVFALTWMADQWAAGREEMWSCYRKVL